MRPIYLLIFSSFLLTSCMFDSDEVKMVKSGTFYACSQKTVEQAVDGFFGSPEWESGQSDDGVKFVNITGEMTYMEKPVKGVVQFRIGEDGKSFNYQAFELNGIPQNQFVAMALIRKMCDSNN